MSESSSKPTAKADQIRERVASSQERNRGRSGAQPTPPDPRSVVDKTVQDHPLALLAGSLIMGAVAANLLKASLGRKVLGQVLGVAVAAGELGSKYGNRTLAAAGEAGRSGQERLARIGDAVAEESAEVRRRAAELSAEAKRRALSLASEAAAEAREAGGNALKQLGKIGGRS